MQGVYQYQNVRTASAVTILNGENISEVIDLGATQLCKIIIPGNFDGDSISFLDSNDNTIDGIYVPYVNGKSELVQQTGIAALIAGNPDGACMGLVISDYVPVQFIKIVSDTVQISGNAIIKLLTRPL